MIVSLLAVYGLVFGFKQADGPFGIVSRLRNWLFRIPVLGVQIYKASDCSYCLGAWMSGIIFMINVVAGRWQFGLIDMAVWCLGGAAFSLILDSTLSRLNRE